MTAICGKLQILLSVFGMSSVVFGRRHILFCVLTKSVNLGCHINFTAVGSSSYICLRDCRKTDRLKRIMADVAVTLHSLSHFLFH